ncbi:hypothetical protein [Mycobacterium sp. CnD-18-1]|uniref:hypothetical protein n=1 Tax=Mycobacterium sp. CnD-18-1 TaxID=2917744 RepID=UPI001EF38468|nr:hypothetical protein [Mycobacterium sp. CnD-18-1]MCG7607088.1 hypothetical protein [Mycobacterium sp. CnD-18-1]
MIPYAPKVVRNYLLTVLDDDVRVAWKVPANRPAKLVTIKMIPMGDSDNIVLSPRRLIISVWGSDEDVTGELAETVCAEMRKAKYIPGNGIRDVKIPGTPGRYDDPDDPSVRFQMTVDVLLRDQV